MAAQCSHFFCALFAFALNNQEAVTLHLFFGAQWQAPLVLVLLAAVLVLGVVLGVLVAMLPLWLARQKGPAPGHRRIGHGR